jgi:antitoxin ParD1/3/4
LRSAAGRRQRTILYDARARPRAGASEVIRASLRLLEEHEQKINALRQALIDGEKSGDAGELDMDDIKRMARRRAKSAS